MHLPTTPVTHCPRQQSGKSDPFFPWRREEVLKEKCLRTRAWLAGSLHKTQSLHCLWELLAFPAFPQRHTLSLHSSTGMRSVSPADGMGVMAGTIKQPLHHNNLQQENPEMPHSVTNVIPQQDNNGEGCKEPIPAQRPEAQAEGVHAMGRTCPPRAGDENRHREPGTRQLRQHIPN